MKRVMMSVRCEVPVIGFHGSDPAHQAMGGLGGLLHHIRLKVGVLDVRPDFGNDVRKDVVLVVCLKLLQKACSSNTGCLRMHLACGSMLTLLHLPVLRIPVNGLSLVRWIITPCTCCFPETPLAECKAQHQQLRCSIRTHGPRVIQKHHIVERVRLQDCIGHTPLKMQEYDRLRNAYQTPPAASGCLPSSHRPSWKG